MKQSIITSIKQVTSDRLALLFIGVLAAGVLAYIGYIAINVHPSDLQLANRYTSYGQTHYYDDTWWNLLNFIAFAVLFLGLHIGMIAKLLVIGMKDLAYGIGALSLVLLVLMFAYTIRVLGVAY